MEFGSRALGNRSILANPGEKNIRDIINSKIKRRESFRPFAPSILEEYIGDWFEKSDKVPFMSMVHKIKYDKRKIIPSVTHVDGSGRLQSVSRKNNPDYYLLIKKFYELSNIPILLNTSFNENEPIVNKPEEALECFLRTNMDILILNTYLISRGR
jgi:carbamoyltransferase